SRGWWRSESGPGSGPGWWSGGHHAPVGVEGLTHRAVQPQPATVEVETSGAEPGQIVLVVRDQHERAPFGQESFDGGIALLAELSVPDRRHLVHQQDRVLQAGDHREAQPYLHPR